ncbi:PREDICTED: syntaxin-8 isoform X2 [Bison bison bison]|uniref:Syntaxin-8 n=1 Tax=Bison bison bison TaxID=43346 RepID=A0A6P3HGE6_BISBB|nr:PREDICTED: syntaxin-8 isoform X2 [Bison bison bison]
MAPDPWFSTYDSTCQIAQEIAEKIQQRNQYERNGENTTKLTVTIRALLQKLKEKIALLKDLLLRAVATHQITQLEGDRRQNLLDDLVTRERLLLASFKNEGAEPDLTRSSLMTGGAKRGAPNPWLLEEPEETRGLGFDEIRQQQQKIIQEQDAGLDALSSIISRQKQMGQEIGNELDEQNEIIDDLANLVENTDEKLRTETRRVNLVDRKSTSCDRADGAGEQWSCVFQATSSDPEVPLCLHHVTPHTRSLQRKSCVMLPGRPGLCSCCGQLSVVSRLKTRTKP